MLLPLRHGARSSGPASPGSQLSARGVSQAFSPLLARPAPTLRSAPTSSGVPVLSRVPRGPPSESLGPCCSENTQLTWTPAPPFAQLLTDFSPAGPNSRHCLPCSPLSPAQARVPGLCSGDCPWERAGDCRLPCGLATSQGPQPGAAFGQASLAFETLDLGADSRAAPIRPPVLPRSPPL